MSTQGHMGTWGDMKTHGDMVTHRDTGGVEVHKGIRTHKGHGDTRDMGNEGHGNVHRQEDMGMWIWWTQQGDGR